MALEPGVSLSLDAGDRPFSVIAVREIYFMHPAHSLALTDRGPRLAQILRATDLSATPLARAIHVGATHFVSSLLLGAALG